MGISVAAASETGIVRLLARIKSPFYGPRFTIASQPCQGFVISGALSGEFPEREHGVKPAEGTPA